MSRLGEAMEAARVAAGVTSRKAAKAAGCSHQYLRAIELGKARGFGGVRLEALAKALGCDVGVLILAAELDDGYLNVRLEGLPEVARVFLRTLARGVSYPLSFWEGVSQLVSAYKEEP